MADSVLKYENLIGKDDTFTVLFEQIEQLKKELIDLAQILQGQLKLINPNEEEAVKSIVKEVGTLTDAYKKLQVEEKKAQITKKKVMEMTDAELAQREKQKIIDRERVQLAKQESIINNEKAGKIEKLRAQLSVTTIKWKKLTEAELKNKDIGGKLIKEKKQLTDELKKLERQTGDNRRNVGNYSDALSGLGGQFGIIGVAFNTLTKGFRGLKNIFPAIIGGFKTLRGAIISTGIGALVVAFGSLVTFLGRTQRGLDFVSKAFAGVTATIDVIIDRIAKFGEALGAAFSGDFSRAAELFKQSVTGVGAEIAKEAGQALELEKALQKLQDRENDLILTKAKRERQIATLERLAEENKNNDKKRSAEQLKEAINLSKGIADTEVAIAKERARIKVEQNKMAESTREDIKEEKQLLAAVENVEKQREDRIRGLTRKLNSLTNTRKKDTKAIQENTKEFKDNTDLRIKAIESLQNKIMKAEADNTEDQTERLLALEDAKYKELQTKRKLEFEKDLKLIQDHENNIKEFYTKNSDEFKENEIDKRNEIRELKKLYQKLEQEDLKLSEKKKNEIIDNSFDDERKITIEQHDAELQELEDQEDKKAKAQTDAIMKTMHWRSETEKEELEFERELSDLKIQNIEDENQREIALMREMWERKKSDIMANEKYTLEQRKQLVEEVNKLQIKAEKDLNKKLQQERTKQVVESLNQLTAAVGSAVIKSFEKELEQITEALNEKDKEVENQRERAEKGLTNTLKFEQEERAKLEAQQIRAEKKKKETAEILALFNLVSAYAASGNSDALTKGLIDWSLLKALGEGFEDGGYTGLGSSNSDIKGLVHANEYVVTAADTAKYGLIGKDGSAFGEAMSDYFYTPLHRNNYPDQNVKFKEGLNKSSNTFNRLENEVKEMRKALENIPKNNYDLLQMTDYFVEISKRVTNNRMTKITKQRKRL